MLQQLRTPAPLTVSPSRRRRGLCGGAQLPRSHVISQHRRGHSREKAGPGPFSLEEMWGRRSESSQPALYLLPPPPKTTLDPGALLPHSLSALIGGEGRGGSGELTAAGGGSPLPFTLASWLLLLQPSEGARRWNQLLGMTGA